jgi:hypothetical protein
MRQKMITLCPTTYELAKKMPNFSSWVRLKLMEMHFEDTPAGQAIPTKLNPCPNCGNSKGDHFCQPLGMFVKGMFE